MRGWPISSSTAEMFCIRYSMDALVRAASTPFRTLDQVVSDKLQDMVGANFRFYRQINDNPDFAKEFLGWMFQRYRKAKEA